MAHLVRYRDAQGNDAKHEVDELADAIAHVERLRNEEGVEGARIYRMEEVEVSFEFKPYFRVEIGSTGPASSLLTVPPVAAAAAPTPAPVAETAADPEPADADDAEPSMAPVWAPPAETTAELEDRTPAHMAVDSTVTVDPWADAPPPPPAEDAVAANGSGRRGLFGR